MSHGLLVKRQAKRMPIAGCAICRPSTSCWQPFTPSGLRACVWGQLFSGHKTRRHAKLAPERSVRVVVLATLFDDINTKNCPVRPCLSVQHHRPPGLEFCSAKLPVQVISRLQQFPASRRLAISVIIAPRFLTRGKRKSTHSEEAATLGVGSILELNCWCADDAEKGRRLSWYCSSLGLVGIGSSLQCYCG